MDPVLGADGVTDIQVGKAHVREKDRVVWIARKCFRVRNQGVIESRPGRGVFLLQRKQILTKTERKRRLNEALDNLISQTLTNLYIENKIGGTGLLWNAEAAATLTLTPLLFILAEVSPKILFRKNARTLMLQCAYALRLFMILFAPITHPLRALFKRLIRQPDAEAGKEAILHLSPQRVRMFFSQSILPSQCYQLRPPPHRLSLGVCLRPKADVSGRVHHQMYNENLRSHF